MADRLRVVEGGQDTVVSVDGDRIAVSGDTLIVHDARDGHLSIGERQGAIARSSKSLWVGLDGHVFEFVVEAGTARRSAARGPESLMPPMSATVVRVNVSAGDHVHAGDVLVLLEAMKMELPVRAPRDGVIRAVRCRAGELVHPDTQLIDLE